MNPGMVMADVFLSTPFMLDSYEAEYNEVCRNQNRHALELDQLRNANRNLSFQVCVPLPRQGL